ncbi:DUF3097 family protein [Rothia santali]|uniref:DUF3097 family protein n=1 Tax=Rothia santali TaxID=2949643 RepID=UPI00359F229F
MVIEEVQTGWVGAAVSLESIGGQRVVGLEDRHGAGRGVRAARREVPGRRLGRGDHGGPGQQLRRVVDQPDHQVAAVGVAGGVHAPAVDAVGPLEAPDDRGGEADVVHPQPAALEVGTAPGVVEVAPDAVRVRQDGAGAGRQLVEGPGGELPEHPRGLLRAVEEQEQGRVRPRALGDHERVGALAALELQGLAGRRPGGGHGDILLISSPSGPARRTAARGGCM